jgi:hypothetical protein
VAFKSALGFSENAACARCRMKKHSLSPYHLQQGSSRYAKIAAIANKFAATTLARSFPVGLVLACKSRKLTFPKFTKRLRKLTFLKFTKVQSALNPVLQVPEVHKRSKAPSGLNPQTSRSSLGSRSGPPNVPSVLNSVLPKFPQLSILLSRFLRSTDVL